MAYKEVVGLFQKQADEIYYVHIGDEIIEVTGEHPFWLDGRGWTYVKDLKVGDLLLSSDGTKLAIDKIEKESREATVYNFEVEDYHSYFVSNLGIWVHNCDINPKLLSGVEGTGKLERSEHAILRSKEGRPVGSAINDVQKARQSDILVQEDGRWIIKGDNGRIHIVEADGSQVVTAMRIQDGRWSRPSEAEFQQFKETFSEYVRW